MLIFAGTENLSGNTSAWLKTQENCLPCQNDFLFGMYPEHTTRQLRLPIDVQGLTKKIKLAKLKFYLF
jgi:hypothetical protein